VREVLQQRGDEPRREWHRRERRDEGYRAHDGARLPPTTTSATSRRSGSGSRSAGPTSLRGRRAVGSPGCGRGGRHERRS
jgi:hypothetical protein